MATMVMMTQTTKTLTSASSTKKSKRSNLRIGIVVPHIFMHREILPHVIFSPAKLALDLASGLQSAGQEVTLFSPGPVDTPVTNITADLSLFEDELRLRGDSYAELLKKHPFTFITLSRQVQSELIAKAYQMANDNKLDIVHVYTNEEDTALPFAALCNKPVVFTHHDPFNFLVKYKNLFPKYKHLNWVSMSYAQREGMPKGTNWVGNVYHGLSEPTLKPIKNPANDYIAYLGRIIQPKGVHLAIKAVLKYNEEHPDVPLKLKIAGKHYSGHKKDTYWQEQIEPQIDGEVVSYVGFIASAKAKRDFLGNAEALIVPSLFDEPFGLVSIEAMACGTPVIGLNSGAIPEVIDDKVTGFITQKVMSENILDEPATVHTLVRNLERIGTISRDACRRHYQDKFTVGQMIAGHLDIYKKLTR